MELKPIQTLVILLVFAVIGIPAAWLVFKGTAPSGPGDVGVDAQGNLYAHYHDRVFKFSGEGEALAVYDLKDVGASGLIGGLSLFADGDWLVVPEGIESGPFLHRCSTSAGLRCQRLEHPGKEFWRTLRTAVAAPAGFYLSDSARHALTLHRADGEQLAKSAESLRHPGEVKLYGDILAVADVDHFRMKLFQPDPDSGAPGEAVASFTVKSPDLNEAMIDQPVDFVRHGGLWYVLVKDVTMSFARLRRFSADGDYIDSLPLPDNGMIMAIEKLGDSLVLPDFRRKRLLRVGLDGETLAPLSSPAWEQQVQRLEGDSKFYLWSGISLWVVFAVLMIAGFVVGIRAQRQAAGQEAQRADETLAAAFAAGDTPPPASLHNPAITWLRSNRQMQWLGWLMLGCMVATLATGFMLPAGKGGQCAQESLQLVMLFTFGLFALVGLPVWWTIRSKQRTRLGVCNEWLVLDSPDAGMAVCRARDVRQYRNLFLVLDTRKLHIGTPQLSFFHKDDQARYIAPLLQAAPAMSSREWGRWRREHDRRAQVLEWLLTGALLLLLLWWFFGGEEKMDAWMDQRDQACEQAQQAAAPLRTEA